MSFNNFKIEERNKHLELDYKRFQRREGIIIGIKDFLLNDYIKVSVKDYKNPFFRLFSNYMYKPGADYHVAQTSIVIFIIFYTFLFFS